MVSKAAILILCALATTTFAKRELNQVPAFQSTGINVVNAAGTAQNSPATPAATTAPGAQQATVVPQDIAENAPSVAPSQVVTAAVLPQTPAQQPTAQALPTVPAPAPATTLPVATTPAPAPATTLPVTMAPVPAPQTASPPPMAPAPAPAFFNPVLTIPRPGPAPAPMMMAPAPAPVSPPLCGVQPTCRLFVEDMLCCENAGALTSQHHAVMRLQCTHAVNYSPKCFNVTGPSNQTAFTQTDESMWSRTHAAQVNFQSNFTGNVSIDIEGPRTNSTTSGDCGLYITPCLYEGQLIQKVAPVLGMSFTTIPPEDFLDVSSSIDMDINDLDSLVYPNLFYPQACQQQNVGALNSTFFQTGWSTYTGGFTNQCNYTAFVDALPPSMTMPGSVQTASLG